MIQKKAHSVKAALVLLMIAAGLKATAQDWKSDEKINVLFGLSQPILASGFNIEGNYINNRFIFDYSHGVSLDFKGNTVSSDLRRQGVAVHMPWTTGFGIGYRIAPWLNLRVEPKFHRFEFYYENQPQEISNQITAYNTFTLGAGLYGAYQPFKTKHNFLSGLMVSPSIRFWPTVSSTLKGNQFGYFNRNTSGNESIKTLDPGFGFTPFIFNVSIGYSLPIRRR